MHRDIKPDNIMVTKEMKLTLVDFGVCCSMCDLEGTPSKRVGTLGYVAPEVLLQDPDMPITYDSRADFYSAGVVLYCMITGKNPFKRSTEQLTLINNYNGIVDFEDPII